MYSLKHRLHAHAIRIFQFLLEDVGTAHLLFIKNQQIGKAFHPTHPFLP